MIWSECHTVKKGVGVNTWALQDITSQLPTTIRFDLTPRANQL